MPYLGLSRDTSRIYLFLAFLSNETCCPINERLLPSGCTRHLPQNAMEWKGWGLKPAERVPRATQELVVL